MQMLQMLAGTHLPNRALYNLLDLEAYGLGSASRPSLDKDGATFDFNREGTITGQVGFQATVSNELSVRCDSALCLFPIL